MSRRPVWIAGTCALDWLPQEQYRGVTSEGVGDGLCALDLGVYARSGGEIDGVLLLSSASVEVGQFHPEQHLVGGGCD